VRKDAIENRKRLILAARHVLRERGADAPLEMITEEAGLTRGTLYRNFRDRIELYQAVLDHEVDLIKQEMRSAGDGSLFLVMRKLIDVSDIYLAYASAVQNTATPTEVCSPADLMADLLEVPLALAKGQGLVRLAVTAHEVLLACRMVAYGWRLDGEPDRDVAIGRRLSLMLSGLVPDGRTAA
jgi:AcrR family transcriptional regulator